MFAYERSTFWKKEVPEGQEELGQIEWPGQQYKLWARNSSIYQKWPGWEGQIICLARDDNALNWFGVESNLRERDA